MIYSIHEANIGFGKNKLSLSNPKEASNDFKNNQKKIQKELGVIFKREINYSYYKEESNYYCIEIKRTVHGYIGSDILIGISQDHLNTLKSEEESKNLYDNLISKNTVESIIKGNGFKPTVFDISLDFGKSKSMKNNWYKVNNKDITFIRIEYDEFKCKVQFYCIENTEANKNKITGNGIFESVQFLN